MRIALYGRPGTLALALCAAVVHEAREPVLERAADYFTPDQFERGLDAVAVVDSVPNAALVAETYRTRAGADFPVFVIADADADDTIEAGAGFQALAAFAHRRPAPAPETGEKADGEKDDGEKDAPSGATKAAKAKRPTAAT